MTATSQQVLAEVYDAGAAAYARWWAPALHRHAADLVTGVDLPAPGGADRSRTVVDVASGAGTLLPDLVRLAGEGGRVVALDRSLGMLRQAPGTVPRVQADAQALPLSTRSADVLVLAFVLFLLPDARKAVAEAARVLRPGGWFLAATWGTQLGTAADAIIREGLDAAGAPAFPDLARSDALTDSPARMAALLADDFTEVRTVARPLEARFEASSVLAMRTGAGPLGWRFRRLDAAGRAAFTEGVAHRLADLGPDDLVDRSEVLLSTARRREDG